MNNNWITRRAFDSFLERSWLALALVPWRASAQSCTGCPGVSVTFSGGTCGGYTWTGYGCVKGTQQRWGPGYGVCFTCCWPAPPNFCYNAHGFVFLNCSGIPYVGYASFCGAGIAACCKNNV